VIRKGYGGGAVLKGTELSVEGGPGSVRKLVRTSPSSQRHIAS
jgi:hypothetical protein